MSREACNIDGVIYCAFHWTPDFSEDDESSSSPVWILLPSLLPNFYHESFLHILTAPIGKFIRCDKTTRCVTRTNGAQLFEEMDAAKEPLPFFRLGSLGWH